jgi:hypothetical protein
MNRTELFITIFVFTFLVSLAVFRIILRAIGYDQRFYQRLYDRDRHTMTLREQTHMEAKFNVK